MMVAMAGLQVFIVRFFFQGARKGKFLDAKGEVECEWLTWSRLRVKRFHRFVEYSSVPEMHYVYFIWLRRGLDEYT